MRERMRRALCARWLSARSHGRLWRTPGRGLAGLLGGDACTCDVVAIGKASVGMAGAVAERLGTRVRKGIVLAAAGREEESERLRVRCRGLSVRVVDHPTPTARNVRAAAEVERFVREGAKGESGATIVVLISGGGSAHLTLPAEGVTLGEIAEVSKRLMRAGADIAELNTVRKHLERLKGGRLAELACAGGDAGVRAGRGSRCVGCDR
jgi:glycerate-2-kinase